MTKNSKTLLRTLASSCLVLVLIGVVGVVLTGPGKPFLPAAPAVSPPAQGPAAQTTPEARAPEPKQPEPTPATPKSPGPTPAQAAPPEATPAQPKPAAPEAADKAPPPAQKLVQSPTEKPASSPPRRALGSPGPRASKRDTARGGAATRAPAASTPPGPRAPGRGQAATDAPPRAPAGLAGDERTAVTLRASDVDRYSVFFRTDADLARAVKSVKLWVYLCGPGGLVLVPPLFERGQADVSQASGTCSRAARRRLRLRKLQRPTPALEKALKVDGGGFTWYVQLDDALSRQVDELLEEARTTNGSTRPVVVIAGDGSISLLERPRLSSAQQVRR